MRIICIISLILGAWTSTQGQCLAQTKLVSEGLTKSVLTKLDYQLIFFETNKSPEAIRGLDNVLDLLEDSDKSAKDRKVWALMWLGLLSAIDVNKSEIYTNLSWKVTPPPDGPNGMRYPSGITAETLKDPVARSNYEAAIKVNNARVLQANMQTALAKLDRRASKSADLFFQSYYTSSADDEKELKNLLENSHISTVRKHSIYVLVK